MLQPEAGLPLDSAIGVMVQGLQRVQHILPRHATTVDITAVAPMCL